jgi:DNA-binding response OmpR family regulator
MTLTIILTGSGLSNEEEAKGLKLGAADYIEKPFDIKVLKERIKNVLQGTKNKLHGLKVIAVGDISLINFPLMLKNGNQEIPLTTEEYYFMYLLLKNHGELVEYQYICKEIWQDKDDGRCKKALFCVVDRLRVKLGEKNRNIIKTIKNKGFIFKN